MGIVRRWRATAIAPIRSVADYFRVFSERLRGDTPGVHAGLAESRHRREEERLSARVIAAIADGVMVTDAQRRIVLVNDTFSRVTGYSAEEALGRTPAMLQSGRQDAAFYAEMWRGIDETGHWQGEIWNRRKNGEIYPEFLSVSVVRGAGGAITNYVGVFNDISASKRHEERLRQLAYHDALTGLANRGLFEQRIREALARARRLEHRASVDGLTGLPNRTVLVELLDEVLAEASPESPVALLFVDLDDFKQVNDRFGHAAGDAALVEAGRRLRLATRNGDVVGRFGGDEFAVLLEVIEDERDAGTVAGKLVEALAIPYRVAGRELRISASIGIARFPWDGADAEALIKRADTAMYRAKSEGRDCYRLFSGGMDSAAGAPGGPDRGA